MADDQRVVCVECARPIDPRVSWYSVEGWGRHRSQGGDNRVALKKLTGRYMCNGCMVVLQSGGDTKQLAL